MRARSTGLISLSEVIDIRDVETCRMSKAMTHEPGLSIEVLRIAYGVQSCLTFLDFSLMKDIAKFIRMAHGSRIKV